MAERTDHSRADEFSHDPVLIQAALNDVTVPAGLDERIKSALRARLEPHRSPTSTLDDASSRSLSRSDLDSTSLGSSDLSSHSQRAADPSGAEVGGGGQREWLRRSLIVLALAAGICGFALLASRWTRSPEPSWLASHCKLILEKIDDENPATWERLERDSPDIPAAVKAQLARVAFVARRPLAGLGSKLEGTLYRLDAGDGRGIILMKLDSLPTIRGLTSRFEVLPQPSGGWSLAAMSVGRETFVLAAACTEQQIFSYIRRLALT
ncbi:MAG: hypothetical protein ACTHOU_08995 [Aureliella sp.]